MKKKKLIFLGIAVFIMTMLLNFSYALDNYGLSKNKLTINVMAYSTVDGEIKLNGASDHVCELYAYKPINGTGETLFYPEAKTPAPDGYKFAGNAKGEYRTCVSSGDNCTTLRCRKSWNTTQVY